MTRRGGGNRSTRQPPTENTMQNRSKEYIENHREYSRWIMWRCIIDAETAEYIMHDTEMRQRIAAYRRPHHARH